MKIWRNKNYSVSENYKKFTGEQEKWKVTLPFYIQIAYQF